MLRTLLQLIFFTVLSNNIYESRNRLLIIMIIIIIIIIIIMILWYELSIYLVPILGWNLGLGNVAFS